MIIMINFLNVSGFLMVMGVKCVEEGKIEIKISSKQKISKKLEVFYNPVMKLNRDISIILLNSLKKKNMQIGLPLSGTGIRGLRFLNELKKGIVGVVCFNDYSKVAVDRIKENLESNKISKGYELSCKDANNFILDSKGFDYIDVDPFGTPNPFLDSAVKRISRDGILAVTATDTSALCGTYPKACKRKYWAVHEKNPIMHEIGLRILIRKIQLIGAQYDKALVPIFCYSKGHYMRIFLKCEKGKKKVDKVLSEMGIFCGYGPIWLGQLWDLKIVNKMLRLVGGEVGPFIDGIKKEAEIGGVGFFHVHKLVKENNIKSIPKKDELFAEVEKLGYKISGTHFNPLGVRSNMPISEFVLLLKKFKKKK